MFAIKRRAGRFEFRELLLFAPTVFLLMAVMHFFTQWAFMRFLLYHQQYQILPADSYICQIYTAEDYRKLADRNLDTVFLSDGSQLRDRTEAWYNTVLPQIKRLDEDHYVRVTTLGTAHYLRNWLTATMPMAMLCMLGLAVSVYSIRRLRSLIQAERDPIRQKRIKTDELLAQDKTTSGDTAQPWSLDTHRAQPAGFGLIPENRSASGSSQKP